MGSQNDMLIQTTDLIDWVTTCSRGAKIEGGVGSKEPHSIPGNLWETHPLQQETVWMVRVKWSSLHSTQMRVSRESGQFGQIRRGFRVKVNLPTFKDKKAKDTVSYCWCNWCISVFHHSGWDDYHLLPFIFRSLQGFPGDLARSLGEDATLGDILQMLDEHYAVVMIFYTLSKELYSLKQGIGENVAEFGVCLSQWAQTLQMEYPSWIQQEHVEEVRWDCFYKGLNPEHW